MDKKLLLPVFLLITACSQPSADTRYTFKSNSVYTAYEYYNLDERKDRLQLKEFIGIDPVNYEWCAAFVNAVLRKDNLPTSDTVSEYPLTARSFLNLGTEVNKPEKGDVIVLPRGEPWQGHVGFYVSSKTVDGIEYYYILGGNQNNKVSIDLYPAYKVLSIRRIDV